MDNEIRTKIQAGVQLDGSAILRALLDDKALTVDEIANEVLASVNVEPAKVNEAMLRAEGVTLPQLAARIAQTGDGLAEKLVGELFVTNALDLTKVVERVDAAHIASLAAHLDDSGRMELMRTTDVSQSSDHELLITMHC